MTAANKTETLITESVRDAAAFIRRGELVAFPTETVYGLGADATNADAVKKIFDAKGRPADNPMIVHIACPEDLDRLVRNVSEAARLLVETFFPGPLTLIMERHPDLPAMVSAGLPTVAVRMPAHETAIALIREAGVPVVAPSANLSGRPSPTTWEAVEEDLGGRIACILKGERTRVGIESTVVDCSRPRPAVLRLGGITLDALRTVVPETTMLQGDQERAMASPGLRHRHYAPRARVVLIDGPEEIAGGRGAAYIGLDPVAQPGQLEAVVHATDPEDYAHRLYEFFRVCDRLAIETIYCQRVLNEGMGAALLDRLNRAAMR